MISSRICAGEPFGTPHWNPWNVAVLLYCIGERHVQLQACWYWDIGSAAAVLMQACCSADWDIGSAAAVLMQACCCEDAG